MRTWASVLVTLMACTGAESTDSDTGMNIDTSDSESEACVETLWYLDADGDGVGTDDDTLLACEQPDGFAAETGDCDPENPDIYPGAEEICYTLGVPDGADQNCDGIVDEDCPRAHCGDVDQDETWDPKYKHYVTCPVMVQHFNEPTLTIPPGTRIFFSEGGTITVGDWRPGALVAEGTAEAPITMVANIESPSNGFWAGVHIRPLANPSSLKHIVIDHGGSHIAWDGAIHVDHATATVEDVLIRNASIGLWLSNADLTLNRVTVEDATVGVQCHVAPCLTAAQATSISATDAALHVPASDVAAFESGITFGSGHVLLDATDIDSDVELPDLGIPYRVAGALRVAGVDASLRITDSVVAFEPDGLLQVGDAGPGELHLIGSDLRSTEDPAGAGDWCGIELAANHTASTMVNSTIAHAGSTDCAGAAVDLQAGSLTVDGFAIDQSAGDGLRCSPGSTATITGFTHSSVAGSPTNGCD